MYSCDYLSSAKICNLNDRTIILRANGEEIGWYDKNFKFISKIQNFYSYKLAARTCEEGLFEAFNNTINENSLSFDTLIIETAKDTTRLFGKKEIFSKFEKDGRFNFILNIH